MNSGSLSMPCVTIQLRLSMKQSFWCPAGVLTLKLRAQAAEDVGGLWAYSDEIESDQLGTDPSRQRVHSSMCVCSALHMCSAQQP